MKHYERLMGKVVLVTKTLERYEHEIELVSENSENKVLWRTKECSRERAGWIVGVRFLQEGIYHGSSGPDYD